MIKSKSPLLVFLQVTMSHPDDGAVHFRKLLVKIGDKLKEKMLANKEDAPRYESSLEKLLKIQDIWLEIESYIQDKNTPERIRNTFGGIVWNVLNNNYVEEQKVNVHIPVATKPWNSKDEK